MDFEKLNEKIRQLTLNQILVFIAAAALVIFILLTIAGFVSGEASLGGVMRKPDPTPEQVLQNNPDSTIYDMIGQIRVPTKTDSTDHHAIIVVSPWLAYDGNDRVFFEELDTKLQSIRASVYEYFASRTESEIKRKGEDAVKAEILEVINEKLILGKVEAVYFRDYDFIK